VGASLQQVEPFGGDAATVSPGLMVADPGIGEVYQDGEALLVLLEGEDGVEERGKLVEGQLGHGIRSQGQDPGDGHGHGHG
jgi:hypothetical protein